MLYIHASDDVLMYKYGPDPRVSSMVLSSANVF